MSTTPSSQRIDRARLDGLRRLHGDVVPEDRGDVARLLDWLDRHASGRRDQIAERRARETCATWLGDRRRRSV